MNKHKNHFVVILIAIIVSGCSSNSDSFNLGYAQGSSEAFSQVVFYGSSSPQSQCSLILRTAKEGTPNDGIDWENVDSGDFLKGCFDGYKDAHPEMGL
jgi:hypothetical protein